MPETTSPSSTPWLRFAVVLGLLTFSGITLASNVLPARDDLRSTRDMLDAQERENEETRERIDRLRDDAEALGNDPWVVGRTIREELNRTEPDEIRVR